MASNLINACPRGPEFDALVNHPEIGRFQAVRDWMENDMEIRPVQVVLDKLKLEQENVVSRDTVISSSTMNEFETKLKDRLLDFVKGLGITVKEEADQLLDENSIVNMLTAGNTMSAFDVLQKFLALRRDADIGDLSMQVANIVYTFLGKKSRLGIELWKNIDQWSKYDELYAMYDKRKDMAEYISEDIEYGNRRYNAWARKQVIVSLIAEALQSGVDLKTFSKEKNPDVSKELFEKYGYKDKYAKNYITRMWNKIWNFFREMYVKVVRTYNEDKLISMALELADDVFKKDYTKFIRGIVSKDGKFFNDEGIELEQKDYYETLKKDAFAADVIDKLFKHPFIDYRLSGSQVLRKYGVILRSVNEDLHDIDGVITLEQFRSESNSFEFLNWLKTRGLYLQREFKETGQNKTFLKEVIPFLEQQNWYTNLKTLFPTWTLENAFIGRDHKFAESVTITGYIEHPTEMEVVKQDANWKAPGRKDAGQLRPKRYILDFFLRTDEGDYPEIFDNYFKDWKQIFEAKLNMGRGKDLSDLVYFTPFIEDKYKFTNKGFRYFTFNNKSKSSSTVDVETPLPNVKRVYRGTTVSDEGREFLYFSVDREEAKDYGQVEVYDVNTEGFLNVFTNKDVYYALTLSFNKETGLTFDLFDNSKEGRITQRKFFAYMKEKGWKGLDYTDYSDSKYLISFDGNAVKKVSEKNAVAYNRDHPNHRFALEKLERGLDNAGYYISEKGYMNYDLSKDDQSRIDSIIRAAYPPDNWTLRQTQYGSWYIAGYKGKNVFSPDYYSPSTRFGARRYYRYEDSINDIESQRMVNGKPVTFDKADNANLKAIRQATAIADTLSNKLGVRYEIISTEKARELTAESINPWNGERAFFSDNTVYFIKDQLDPNIAVHEFSHAFVRAIYMSNNKLFNNIYSDLSKTQEGIDIIEQVKKLYPEFKESDSFFMEEAIVRAIELKATKNILEKGVTKEFSSWIDKIMYHIKQLLRSIQKKFGTKKDAKIDVSKINEMTTLDQLSNMLVEADAFDLGNIEKKTRENDSIDDKKVTNYFRSQISEINGLAQVAPEDLRSLATQGIKAAGKTYRKMLRDKNHAEMAEVLKDEFGKDNMDEIRNNLRPYTEYMEKRMSEIIDEVQYNQNHVESLVNTYFRLSKTIKKITEHLKTITLDVDNPENLIRAASYRRVIKYWEDFISYTTTVFNENNISSDNPINQLVTGIGSEIKRANEELSKIKAAGIRETLFTVLEPIGQSAKERFEQMLATYKKYKYKQYAIDRLYVEYYGLTEAEYNELKKMEGTGAMYGPKYQKLKLKSMTGAEVTPEKIEALLKGELNDVNWMNSYFESYMYNDDPIVGGLSLFVKQAIDQTMMRSQMFYNDFAKELVPLLEDIGYNPHNIGALGERIGFKDSFGKVDKDGNLQKYTVWTLLNRWKDYRWKVDELNDQVKQAELQYYRTNSTSDKEKLREANSKRDEHNAMYMHQKYVPEFYRMRSEFTDNGRNKIAVKALSVRDEALATIRNLQEKIPGQEDMFQYNEQIKAAWNDYRQLHSLIDIDGNMKKDESLQIAQELQRFREKSGKFYEYKSIPGSFENALFKEEQRLINKGYKDEAFKTARQKWINENTRVVVKQEFYQERRSLIQRMKELLSKKLADPKVSEEQALLAEEIEKNYNTIFNAVTGYRDDDGQPEATAMSQGRISKVKEAQQNIEDLREKVIGVSGLTKEQQRRLRYLDNKDSLSEKEENELMSLLEKKKSVLTKEQRKELNRIFRDLAELSTTEATDYYVMTINNLLKTLSTDPENMPAMSLLRGYFGSTELDKDQVDELISSDDRNRLILTSLLEIPEFKEWFEKNHIGTVEDVYEGKQYAGQEVVYKRTYVWNVIRPSNPEYYETYDIKDENGRVLQKINRVPSIRFYKREVKQEFETGYDPATDTVKLVVGEHVDNKGRFLPRADVANNPYMNKEYYEMRSKDPKTFKVLEAMTKWHLKFQDKLVDNSAKLYLDFPRFEKTTLELALTKKVQAEEGEKPSRFKLFIKNIKQFFTGSKDQPESGFGWSDEFKVAQLDIFDEDEEYNAPIHGLYDIEIDDVSTNITNSLLRYMMSAQKNATLTEIFPVANALKDVLDGKGYDKFKGVSKLHLTGDGEFTTRNKDQNNTRRKVVENFIDREFYGKTLTGPGADNIILHNLSNGIFEAASLGFFAFNIQSALKNAVGQKIQGMIESIAGRYYNPLDYAKGEAWAFKTMGELSFQIYKKGPKSHNVQLWEIFDPTLEFQNKASKEGMSRTVLADITNPAGIAMNFRKWTELQSMMQIWAAMMYNTMVEQNGKKIQWTDAWEVKDGRIQLKEGVDPEWGITYDAEGNQLIGKKFIQKRQMMQGVLAKLQGAYDDYNQPEAQRYLAFKFISFMRRYFMPMFIDRFGFKWKNGQAQARMQTSVGGLAEGYYISLSRWVYDVFRMGPKKLISATPDERRAWLKTSADLAILYLLFWIQGALFDWDDNDDERFEKLRQKSGPLKGPFVAEDEYDFHLSGWLSNHALSLAMQIRSEQAQFIPWPGLGLRNYNELLDELGSSAAIGPTIGTGFNLFQDIYNYTTGSEKAFYQREVGPYTWQQEEGSKFIAHLAKSMGMTGVFWQPELGIKKLESIEQGYASGGN